MIKRQRQVGEEGEGTALLLSSPDSLHLHVYSFGVCLCICFGPFLPIEGKSYCKPASLQELRLPLCPSLWELNKQTNFDGMKPSELTLAD